MSHLVNLDVVTWPFFILFPILEAMKKIRLMNCCTMSLFIPWVIKDDS